VEHANGSSSSFMRCSRGYSATPRVAAGLFTACLVVLYYSPLLDLSLRSHTAHLLKVLHLLITGHLFASGTCGIDLSRPPHPVRILLLLMVTFGFHALFSVSLMGCTPVLADEWFTARGGTWVPPAQDQHLRASLGLALGRLPVTHPGRRPDLVLGQGR
jgi:cytochrome c oxidase assembly factor CtaG